MKAARFIVVLIVAIISAFLTFRFLIYQPYQILTKKIIEQSTQVEHGGPHKSDQYLK